MRTHRTGLIAVSLMLIAGCRMMSEDQADVLSRVAGVTARTIVRLSLGSANSAPAAEPAVQRDRVVISRDRAALDPAANVIRRCARAAAEVAVPSTVVRERSNVRLCSLSKKVIEQRRVFIVSDDGFVPTGDSQPGADATELTPAGDSSTGAIAN